MCEVQDRRPRARTSSPPGRQGWSRSRPKGRTSAPAMRGHLVATDPRLRWPSPDEPALNSESRYHADNCGTDPAGSRRGSASKARWFHRTSPEPPSIRDCLDRAETDGTRETRHSDSSASVAYPVWLRKPRQRIARTPTHAREMPRTLIARHGPAMGALAWMHPQSRITLSLTDCENTTGALVPGKDTSGAHRRALVSLIHKPGQPIRRKRAQSGWICVRQYSARLSHRVSQSGHVVRDRRCPHCRRLCHCKTPPFRDRGHYQDM